MSASWPLFDLRLRIGALLLRPLTEDDLPGLVAVLPDDVELDPSLPADRAHAVQQGYWRAQGAWSPDAWVLSFLVTNDDRAVGIQVLEGTDFPALRTVDSASWLIPTARGRGLGKGMRAAVLALAFGPLAARAAVTSAWHDNVASLAVSRSLGYRDNGVSLDRRGEQGDVMVHLRLTRDRWADAGLGDPVEIEGFEPCRPLFGL